MDTRLSTRLLLQLDGAQLEALLSRLLLRIIAYRGQSGLDLRWHWHYSRALTHLSRVSAKLAAEVRL